MAQRSWGVHASVVLFGAAALVGGWFAIGSMFAASADAAMGGAGADAAGAVWAAAGAGPAVPVPPLGDASTPVPGAGAGASRAVQLVDQAWATGIAARTGVPVRAVTAYAAAELVLAREQPGCGVGWNTLAGIGRIETSHGTYGGAVVQPNGDALPRILGPALDGNGFAAIHDTEGGAWDGDAQWDRAVGPMQFIPDTWQRWGADGNGDGAADPNNLDDAALAAGRYLCASGSLLTPEGWRAAVFSYNHLDSYVDSVADAASEYAARAAG